MGSFSSHIYIYTFLNYKTIYVIRETKNISTVYATQVVQEKKRGEREK